MVLRLLHLFISKSQPQAIYIMEKQVQISHYIGEAQHHGSWSIKNPPVYIMYIWPQGNPASYYSLFLEKEFEAYISWLIKILTPRHHFISVKSLLTHHWTPGNPNVIHHLELWITRVSHAFTVEKPQPHSSLHPHKGSFSYITLHQKQSKLAMCVILHHWLTYEFT